MTQLQKQNVHPSVIWIMNIHYLFDFDAHLENKILHIHVLLNGWLSNLHKHNTSFPAISWKCRFCSYRIVNSYSWRPRLVRWYAREVTSLRKRWPSRTTSWEGLPATSYGAETPWKTLLRKRGKSLRKIRWKRGKSLWRIVRNSGNPGMQIRRQWKIRKISVVGCVGIAERQEVRSSESLHFCPVKR